MGTWICHLRIAEELLPTLPEIDATAFCFGNLAPDSGLPNADGSAYDPPKEVTHFLLHSGEDEAYIRDMRFYRAYVRRGVGAEASFLLGYFCHLLCDGLWSRRIARPSKLAYAALFQQGSAAAWGALKGDWYDLDQRYVRDHPQCAFWRVIVPAPNPPMYVPLVPSAALHRQLDFIRQFYQSPDPQSPLDRRYPYLSQRIMDRFVAESAEDIGHILGLLAQGAQAEGADTALALLPAEQVRAYDELGE